jgi:hypothetical protein
MPRSPDQTGGRVVLSVSLAKEEGNFLAGPFENPYMKLKHKSPLDNAGAKAPVTMPPSRLEQLQAGWDRVFTALSDADFDGALALISALGIVGTPHVGAKPSEDPVQANIEVHEWYLGQLAAMAERSRDLNDPDMHKSTDWVLSQLWKGRSFEFGSDLVAQYRRVAAQNHEERSTLNAQDGRTYISWRGELFQELFGIPPLTYPKQMDGRSGKVLVTDACELKTHLGRLKYLGEGELAVDGEVLAGDVCELRVEDTSVIKPHEIGGLMRAKGLLRYGTQEFWRAFPHFDRTSGCLAALFQPDTQKGEFEVRWGVLKGMTLVTESGEQIDVLRRKLSFAEGAHQLFVLPEPTRAGPVRPS